MAASLIMEAAESLGEKEKQKAYMIAATIYEKLDRVNMAIRAYEKAMSSGAEMEQVAPRLAAIYGISVEEIMEGEKLSKQVTVYDESYRSHTDTNTSGTVNKGVVKPIKIRGNLSQEKIKTITVKD
jgi:hypothetical protein